MTLMIIKIRIFEVVNILVRTVQGYDPEIGAIKQNKEKDHWR